MVCHCVEPLSFQAHVMDPVVPLSKDSSVQRLPLWKDSPVLAAGDANTLLHLSQQRPPLYKDHFDWH